MKLVKRAGAKAGGRGGPPAWSWGRARLAPQEVRLSTVIVCRAPTISNERDPRNLRRPAAKRPGDEHMTEPRKIARYGWIPDLPDERDHMYAAPPQFLKTLPASTDLRSQSPAVYDQGMLASCTANAIGCALEFDRMKQKLTDFVPSRLFIYYN